MHDVIIRKMREEDIASLSELYKDFWNETSDIDKMLLRFNELNTNDNYIFLSAVIDNGLVGSIMGIVCHELYGEWALRRFKWVDHIVS